LRLWAGLSGLQNRYDDNATRIDDKNYDLLMEPLTARLTEGLVLVVLVHFWSCFSPAVRMAIRLITQDARANSLENTR
jgi:hypothetical protein